VIWTAAAIEVLRKSDFGAGARQGRTGEGGGGGGGDGSVQPIGVGAGKIPVEVVVDLGGIV